MRKPRAAYLICLGAKLSLPPGPTPYLKERNAECKFRVTCLPRKLVQRKCSFSEYKLTFPR
jgi:hypothetical protein